MTGAIWSGGSPTEFAFEKDAYWKVIDGDNDSAVEAWTIDVWAYRRLKNAVDALSEESRRWRVNVYAGVFVIASLLGHRDHLDRCQERLR